MDVALPKAGTYVLAVSGGVDSMVLLHGLHRENNGEWKFVVAHLDHGIREDSVEDRRLVQSTAKDLGLPFVYHEVNLGNGASEAAAREARYNFLRSVQKSSGAQAIITAHHQDDLLETAVINILRGSGRKGLTALTSREDLLRPLLKVPKSDLIDYAYDQGLTWREDSTNWDETYLRNYVRQRMLSRFDDSSRAELIAILSNLQQTNRELDGLLVKQLDDQPVKDTVDRTWFNHLPHNVAREVMATWLREHGIANFDRKTLERLVVAAKTSLANRRFPVVGNYQMQIHNDFLALAVEER